MAINHEMIKKIHQTSENEEGERDIPTMRLPPDRIT